MKVSLNWLRQFGGQGLDVPVEELVTRIGAQLGAVEGVEDLSRKYQGVVVARIVSCVDHPDADRLHVCTIDDGGITPDVNRDENGYVQVVCGAPNVREGMLVAWLPPGSTVPDSVDNDPFVLEARALRGVVSNGMLASPKELDLGENHDGILEIDVPDVAPGASFASVYQLDDHIIEIENKMFTHRPDCFGQLGIAREIAGISQHPFTSPDWYRTALPVPAGSDLTLTVENEIPSLAPRFLVVALQHIKVVASPQWLQTYLLRVGVRPINNVVDITNYMMLLTGQPLHAYDYDKVVALDGGDSATLIVRQPRTDESLALLNGKTIVPRSENIMIATKSQLIGLAGVMGGSETEVDDTTTRIILECASFDMYAIRRSSMAHGLFTDAVTRFNKGQSPLQNDEVLGKAVELLQQIAGAEAASPVIDNNHVDEEHKARRWVHPPVPISTEFINTRLGFALTGGQIKDLLENVEFSVTVEDSHLTVTAPFWRTDVETREDVVEEVGRLYGFDHLPLELPQRSLAPVHKDAMLELQRHLRDYLSRSGANEVLTYSFVPGELIRKVGQNPADAFQVGNALSPDLQYYRLSLTGSLLAQVRPNLKAGYDRFALFEMGKGHNLQHATDDDGLPLEFEMLEFVYAAADKSAPAGAAYYQARRQLVAVATALGIDLEFRPFAAEEAYPVVKPYDAGRSAQIFVRGTDVALGMVGEYKASVRKALKLPDHTAGFGIGLTQLLGVVGAPRQTYHELSRFPKVTQDITLKVSNEVAHASLESVLRETLERQVPAGALLRIEPTSIFQRDVDQAHKQLTFRISMASYERTMTDSEVNKLLDEASMAAADAWQAERV